MDISNYSLQLRELSDDYSNRRILADDYRLKRKELLDEIDKVINGQESGHYENTDEIEEKDLGIFNKIIGVLKNDEDKDKY